MGRFSEENRGYDFVPFAQIYSPKEHSIFIQYETKALKFFEKMALEF